jgi:hypothetical protein
MRQQKSESEGGTAMASKPAPRRYRVHLIQVGRADNVTAVATQFDGARAGELRDISSPVTLQEFLRRPNFEIPDGTPVVRLDLTDDAEFWRHFRQGPHLNGTQPLGTVSPPGSTMPSAYAGEAPAELHGWRVAADVYGQLAAQAGLIVEHTTGSVAAAGHPESLPSGDFRGDQQDGSAESVREP